MKEAIFSRDINFYSYVLRYYFNKVTEIYNNTELQITIFEVTPREDIGAIVNKLNLSMEVTFVPIIIDEKMCDNLIALVDD